MIEDFLKTVAALNDETRILLLRFFDTYGECCVCDLQTSLQMTQSRLSRHLKILKDAKFLQVTRKGTWAYYRLEDEFDPFHQAALEEIRRLQIDLPPLQKAKGCTSS